MAFDVTAGFEVPHGLAEQGFVRGQGPGEMGDVDEVKMVMIPQPVVFGAIVDEEMDVFGHFCRLNG